MSLLCPVECLNRFVARSDVYRSSEQKQLIISWQTGSRRDLKPQTISAYIKQAVVLAYSKADPDLLADMKIVPHTTRHVATSLNALRHFSMKDVLQTGSWSSPNTFISHYLQDFSTDTLSGLSSIGGFVAGGVTFE